MLKKTTAIAVLILMIASLFSGSVGGVQAAAPEQIVVLQSDVIGQTRLLQSFHSFHGSGLPLPRMSPPEWFSMASGDGVYKWFSMASVDGMDIAEGMASGITTGIFVTGTAGEGAGGDTGVMVKGPVSSDGSSVSNTSKIIRVNGSSIKVPDFPSGGESGTVAAGQASSNGSGNFYTTMEIFMDNRMEISDAGIGAFAENIHSGRIELHRTPGGFFPAGAMSMGSRIALYKANGGAPDVFDMKFLNKRDVPFGNDTATLMAHMEIPPAGGENMSMPGWPAGGYALDGYITIDLLKISDNGTIIIEDLPSLQDNQSSQVTQSTRDSESSQDSQYNNEISAGDTKWHSIDISDAVTSFNVDLKWSEDSSPLELTIYAPDGSVLGIYDDSSDGETDGRINLNIANPSGIAAGEWYLKVTDTGDVGKAEYYLKTY